MNPDEKIGVEEQYYEFAPFGQVLARMIFQVFLARSEVKKRGLRDAFERYKVTLEAYYVILPPQLRPDCDPRRLSTLEELDMCLEKMQDLLYRRQLIFPRAEFHRVEVGVNE